MSPSNPSTLHAQSFNFLIVLRASILLDIANACYEYDLDRETAETYRSATPETLLSFAYSLNRSAFAPRYQGAELARLLKTPASLRGLQACVRRT